MNESRVALYSPAWTRAPESEVAVAMRSIAGALSRLAGVDVFVPGEGPPFADGAFDVTPIGGERAERVPGVPGAPYRAVLVEAGNDDLELASTAGTLAAGAPVLSVGAVRARVDGVLDVGLVDVEAPAGGGPVGGAAPAVHHVGLYARVHPGARSRRHYGLGAVPEYLLVLGDRPGMPTSPSPSDRARWLLARFPRRYVVVLEGGTARVWRSRSCVAQFDVHTRMDLWILVAQAWGVVDLLPGDLYARECVESLRYGVPVVVPAGSPADGLVQAAGGMRFTSTADLLSCVEALSEPAVRAALASRGREVADRWYGDPDGLIYRLAGALDLPGPADLTGAELEV